MGLTMTLIPTAPCGRPSNAYPEGLANPLLIRGDDLHGKTGAAWTSRPRTPG